MNTLRWAPVAIPGPVPDFISPLSEPGGPVQPVPTMQAQPEPHRQPSQVATAPQQQQQAQPSPVTHNDPVPVVTSPTGALTPSPAGTIVERTALPTVPETHMQPQQPTPAGTPSGSASTFINVGTAQPSDPSEPPKKRGRGRPRKPLNELAMPKKVQKALSENKRNLTHKRYQSTTWKTKKDVLVYLQCHRVEVNPRIYVHALTGSPPHEEIDGKMMRPPSAMEAAEFFGIPDRTIRHWWSKRDEIIARGDTAGRPRNSR
ncbi:hypothetical protein BJ166DRAFT_590305 [Pestalotiopsis sp. NC0098]|nr:hypothetical protein BJ166DRAFT_590305 [Pestalotiopsis sp. NC0098]